jgi:hypothetical protein
VEKLKFVVVRGVFVGVVCCVLWWLGWVLCFSLGL